MELKELPRIKRTRSSSPSPEPPVLRPQVIYNTYAAVARRALGLTEANRGFDVTKLPVLPPEVNFQLLN